MSLIIDSAYGSLREALRGTTAPRDVMKTLALVNVFYVSFDGRIHQGQLVVHKELAKEVSELFTEMLRLKFPIEKVVPMAAFGWDDERAMEENNSSAFNYRLILGTDRLSNHSFGRALDLNPRQNPYYARDGKVYPADAVYDPSVPGTLVSDGPIVQLFKRYGWIWGGDWTVPLDYQHLEKPQG